MDPKGYSSGSRKVSMSTVRILPEILSNQIAAGEVVERPVSIVKELVENSIDARAENITIEIVNGGKSLIRISDDGIGLSRDDALLAIERYATSKIYTKDDLFCISTMGFRGEALPSIASVSRFSLVTRTKEDEIATRIDMAGGKIINVSDAGAPVGTMVEVKTLFFNTPARKKFLKADRTESSHVVDAVSGMALGHQNIRFRLFANQKLQHNFPLTDDLFQRTVQVLGKGSGPQLYPVDYEDPELKIYGYCSNPSLTRSTSSKIFLFVNHRLIYDRGLISAVFKGFSGRLMKGRFPVGAFFVDIAYDQVDVNVHPSKREVKFFNAQKVYNAMAGAVEQALIRGQKDLPRYAKAPMQADDIKERLFEKFEFGGEKTKRMPPLPQTQPDIQWPGQTSPAHGLPETQPIPVLKSRLQAVQQTDRPMEKITGHPGDGAPKKETAPPFEDMDEVGTQPESKKSRPEHTGLETDLPRQPGDLKVVGQIMGTYILVESGQGLLMIDQHAAHERIVYEQIKRRYERLDVQTQTLAVPQTLELNFKEADHFNQLLPELEKIGFLIEPFGGATYVIKGVPVMIEDRDIQALLIEILDAAMAKKQQAPGHGWLEACLILMACHTAIRANKTLNTLQMKALVEDLERCENSRHCPHGRPIQLFWSKNQIEKLFKRKT